MTVYSKRFVSGVLPFGGVGGAGGEGAAEGTDGGSGEKGENKVQYELTSCGFRAHPGVPGALVLPGTLQCLQVTPTCCSTTYVCRVAVGLVLQEPGKGV